MMTVEVEELLARLRADAGRKMSADEIRAQRISFVMGMVSENSKLTREEVAKIVDEREGRIY